MYEEFKKGLMRYASSRTRRYVMGPALDSGKDTSMTAKLQDVVRTICELRWNISNSQTIETVDGGIWNINDYQVPSFINDYINLGEIYFSPGYARRQDPICVASRQCEDAFKEGRILNPSEFEFFWNSYNEYQQQKISLQKVEWNPAILTDLAICRCQKDDITEDMSEVNVNFPYYIIGGSRFSDAIICFAGDIIIDGLQNFKLVKAVVPTEDEVVTSLFTSSFNGGLNHGDHSITSDMQLQ